MPRDLGRRIREARNERQLTQATLAAKAGVSRIYVAKLEGGERKAPSLAVLERIAKALRVKLVDLLR